MTTSQEKFLPYSRQTIEDDDIAAVVDVLRSDWLTTGPKVEQFENAVAKFVNTPHVVAVSSGTAALHTAMFAIDIKPGDQVLVPSITFAASANCVAYQGGTPIFVDVNPDTLLIDLDDLVAKITPQTKAIIAVDFAGQPCDYEKIRAIAKQYKLILVADACHSLGATYNSQPTGSLADLSIFSFHPVKHIATGEGGMVTTADAHLAERMRRFRNHGINADHQQRAAKGSWYYELIDLGFNYRITDIQCALGISQLKKLPAWIKKRQQIAQQYDSAFQEIHGITPLTCKSTVTNAYHLYVVKINEEQFGLARAEVFTQLRQMQIGVNVHYIPVHLHPYYQTHYQTKVGLCPVAEEVYQEILSLPLFPSMTQTDVDKVITSIKQLQKNETKLLL